MSHTLGPNRYGKSGIRLAVVDRAHTAHEFTDLDVQVRLHGDFDAAHTAGDNAAVLPTDTMRGTCHALARDGVPSVPAYGIRLVERFLEASPAVATAVVELTVFPWERVVVEGQPHTHTFRPAAGGRPTWRVSLTRGGAPEVSGGVSGARVAKTTGSAFSGFLRDEYTTLGETRDRIMATTIDAWWGLTDGLVEADGGADRLGTAVPATMLAAFARHDDSESVQHTMHVMGSAVLDAHPEVTWVRFLLPNEHHILSDLSPYDLDNPGIVYLVADRPFGVIEGVVARDGVDVPAPW
ncbi:factor-independent urate hydroxylase [Euzebya tangerina]|uniref:factor-independent urate hydroxylase n=1 Tax=Euzebya tangerina TaxID=591198 RepID=UPI0013C3291E|nr:urate oxidase [Euzebya tangerina]